MVCPECMKEMDFIENCEACEGEVKTAWNCDDCDHVVYIVKFLR